MWDDFVAWFQSPAGQRVLEAAVIPAVAILVAGALAALIARAAIRSVLARADREALSGSVAALVEVARALEAGAQRGADRERIERLRTEADVRLRLSGVAGAATAAEWASLRLDGIERDAPSPAPQTGPGVNEIRDRLLAWVARPRRAKRLFAADVERLGAERTARRTPKEPAVASPIEPAAATIDGRRDEKPEPSPSPEDARETVREDDQPAGSPPEPVAARAHNLAQELQAERLKTSGTAMADAGAPAAAANGGAPPPSTEPVLIQRTRLDSMDRQPIDPRSDQARHARPGRATAVAATPTEPPVEPPLEPPVAPEPAPEPAAPVGERQATPAWLDTYDDEAEVTRDIDLSKTPPPKAASTVSDRTRTGDDIVPRH